MLARRRVLALLVLLTACDGGSEDASKVASEDAPATAAPSLAPEPKALPVEVSPEPEELEEPEDPCGLEVFEVCEDVCTSGACLYWCGGPKCIDIARDLHACAAPGEQRFVEANPEPEQSSRKTKRAHAKWERAKTKALAEHWEQQCGEPCAEAFPEDDSASRTRRCEGFGEDAHGWNSFIEPPEHPEGLLGALGARGGGFAGGPWINANVPRELQYAGPLALLIERTDIEKDANKCVPKADEEGESFAFLLVFDADGRVMRAEDGEGAEAEKGRAKARDCLRSMLASRVAIPPRAARDLPPIAVEVRMPVEIEAYGVDLDILSATSELGIGDVGMGGMGGMGGFGGGGGGGMGAAGGGMGSGRAASARLDED